MQLHPIIELLTTSMVRYKYARHTYMPMAQKLNLEDALSIIQHLENTGIEYMAKEGSSLRKKLNLSKGTRFTSTVKTLEPLFKWCASDERFIGSRSIRDFVRTETDHLRNNAPQLFNTLKKPSNPAISKKFSWGVILRQNIGYNPLTRFNNSNHSFADELDSYLENRCRALFGLLINPSPNGTAIEQGHITYSLDNHSYEVRGKDLIVRKLFQYIKWIGRDTFRPLHSGSFTRSTSIRRMNEHVFEMRKAQQLLSLMLDRNHNYGNENDVGKPYGAVRFALMECYYTYFFFIESVVLSKALRNFRLYRSVKYCLQFQNIMITHCSVFNWIFIVQDKTENEEAMIVRLYKEVELIDWKHKVLEKIRKKDDNLFELGKKKIKIRCPLGSFIETNDNSIESDHNEVLIINKQETPIDKLLKKHNDELLLNKKREVQIGISDLSYCLN